MTVQNTVPATAISGAPVEEAQVLVRIEGVRLGYGQRIVLDSVSFQVGRGEFWFLLGPNGRGKSTFINGLLGVLPPQQGRIVLNPQLAGYDRIGYVPQRCDLNATIPTTVGEFVLLGLVNVRVNRKEQAERLAWALERVGLAGFAKRGYQALSGGERQRALVARALVRRPAFIIMDEPTVGLDFMAETALLEYLATLNREEQVTVLFVSHDLATAARYGSHVALFYGGGLLAGPLREILQPDHLQRAYGVPAKVAIGADGRLQIEMGATGGGAP